jgi:hypothetical protein
VLPAFNSRIKDNHATPISISFPWHWKVEKFQDKGKHLSINWVVSIASMVMVSQYFSFHSLYPSGVSFILREGHHLIRASTLSTVQNTCKKIKIKKTKSQIFHHLRINIIFPVPLKRLVNK